MLDTLGGLCNSVLTGVSYLQLNGSSSPPLASQPAEQAPVPVACCCGQSAQSSPVSSNSCCCGPVAACCQQVRGWHPALGLHHSCQSDQ